MDYSLQLKAYMRDAGVEFVGEVDFHDTGRVQRFRQANSSRSDHRVWVSVHSDRQGATFGNWGEQDTAMGHWFAQDKHSSRLTRAERVRVTREINNSIKKAERQREEDRRRSYLDCMRKIQHWRQAPANHPYLVKKQLSNQDVMWDGHELLFPMCDLDGYFVTFHRILPDGSKKMAWALKPDGAMVFLSDGICSPIRICEGWATGMAIREAVGGTVLCAIPCGNVPKAVEAVHARYPDKEIIICPDNDQWKAKEIDPRTGKKKRNSGIYYAKKAAKIGNFAICAPSFQNLDVSNEPTDWHDLKMLAGIDEVRRQLLK